MIDGFADLRGQVVGPRCLGIEEARDSFLFMPGGTGTIALGQRREDGLPDRGGELEFRLSGRLGEFGLEYRSVEFRAQFATGLNRTKPAVRGRIVVIELQADQRLADRMLEFVLQSVSTRKYETVLPAMADQGGRGITAAASVCVPCRHAATQP